MKQFIYKVSLLLVIASLIYYSPQQAFKLQNLKSYSNLNNKEYLSRLSFMDPNGRTISFSGYTWLIRPKSYQPQGPGPNYFNDNSSSVYVDQYSRLHLRIYYQQNRWFCSQIYAQRPYGYGSYVFSMEQGFDKIDPRVVVGLFNYLDDTHEIDVELSQWGNPNIQNTQYVVQPGYIQGNVLRFDLRGGSVIHSYTWTQNRILFQTFLANSIAEVQSQIGVFSTSSKLLKQWVYTGKNIPQASTQRVIINLWLSQGRAPVYGQNQQIVIKQFKYLPPRSQQQ